MACLYRGFESRPLRFIINRQNPAAPAKRLDRQIAAFEILKNRRPVPFAPLDWLVSIDNIAS